MGIPVKGTKNGAGKAVGFEEINPSDPIPGNLVAGLMGNNGFINGDLGIWQRRTSGRVGVGTGTLGPEAFFADRFTASALNCTHDVSRGIVGSGATTLPPTTTYAILCQVSGATATSAAWMGQRIENVRSRQGQVTISFKANGTIGNKVGVRVIQSFGTGGSAEVGTEVGVFSADANPTLKQFTFTIPSTAGKILGAGNNDFIYIVFDFCGTGYGGVMAGQNGTYAISDFNIEVGPVATAFEYREPGIEWILCQRFYEVLSYTGATGTTFTSNGDTRCGRNFRVRKREVPRVSFGGSFSVIGAGSDGNIVNVIIDTVTSMVPSVDGVRISGIGNGPVMSGAGAVVTWGDNGQYNPVVRADAEF